MTISFNITQEMVDRFVELTGDHNAMHVSDEFARRFRYRRRVVHGMLPFSALALLAPQLASTGAPSDLWQADVRFLKPVFVGDTIRLELSELPADPQSAAAHSTYEARWTNERTGDLLIRGRCVFRSGAGAGGRQPSVSTPGLSFLSGVISEAAYQVGDLEGRSESLQFQIKQTPMRHLPDDPDAVATANLAATTMLSTLIGMRLPGRFATFSAFQISFERQVEVGGTYDLVGCVEKLSPPTGSMEASFSIAAPTSSTPIASGRYSAMVNTAPPATITSAEIRQTHLDLGLAGKVAVITGASRGIGAATAKLLAAHGVRVVVNYVTGRADAEDVVADIVSAGGAAIAVRADIRQAAEVDAMFARAAAEWGGVDILVNNAVKDFQPRELADLAWDDYLGELEVSLKGLHHCCKAAIPFLKARGGGKIITLSTIAVEVPVKGQSKYITAKSAAVGYCRSLARELAADNIQVNVVTPTMTRTDLLAVLPGEIVRRLGQQRPAGRNLEPIEVAQAIAYLASRWSNAMTGQKLVLNLGDAPFS